MTWLLSSSNFPFTLALTLMLMIGLIEVLGLFLGASLSHLMENLLPNAHGADLHVEHGIFAEIFSWLKIKELPFMIVLIISLLAFGMSGLILQMIIYSVSHNLLPSFIASLVALFIAFPIIRISAKLCSNLLVKEETSAVSQDSFIGMPALIVLGTAEKGSPAQAKVVDSHNKQHYIMVEPMEETEFFSTGNTVLLIERHRGVYFAIESTLT